MRGPAMAHQFRVDIHTSPQIDHRKNPPPQIDALAVLKRSAGRGTETGAAHAFADLAAWTALALMMEVVVRLAMLIIPLLLLCE